MPAEANKPANGKKYNPTVTAMFRDDRFGEDSLVSSNLDAKGFEEIQKHTQIGIKFLVKKSPRVNASGGETFFLEILPPLTDPSRMKTRRSTPPSDDGI